MSRRPKGKLDADQAYFWTEEWQRGEREADKDIEKGRVKSFRSIAALIADLQRARLNDRRARR